MGDSKASGAKASEGKTDRSCATSSSSLAVGHAGKKPSTRVVIQVATPLARLYLLVDENVVNTLKVALCDAQHSFSVESP